MLNGVGLQEEIRSGIWARNVYQLLVFIQTSELHVRIRSLHKSYSLVNRFILPVIKNLRRNGCREDYEKEPGRAQGSWNGLHVCWISSKSCL